MELRNPIGLILMFGFHLLPSGCARDSDHVIPSVDLSVSDGSPQSIDAQSGIELMAREGVPLPMLHRALAGDGPAAVGIGYAFADKNRLAEARYWYQIAAENGDSIGMANLSIAERETSCHRGNFWLRRALDTGGLGVEAEQSMRLALKDYEASCK